MIDQDMVDTMGNGILEAMERKNGRIYDDFYSRQRQEHEMDYDT